VVPHLQIATAPVAPLTPADAAAPAVPVEQAVVEQLVDHLGDLVASHVEGDHEITVQLDPADLGRVELRIRLQDDVVHVHVGAHERPTAELVRHHVDDLRTALEAAGVATGGIDVGQQQLGPRQHADRPTFAPTAQPDAPARPLVRPTIVSDRAVDVLL
jgi:flagellar hook-length control protein FliK